MAREGDLEDLIRRITRARSRIAPHARVTPCVDAAELGRDRSLVLKLENEQHTGSFKLRGALNRILGLSSELRARGVLAASTGNHGAAVAHAASLVGCSARIFAPKNAAPDKLEKMRAAGALS